MTAPTFQPIVTRAGRSADQAAKLPGGAQVLFASILFGDGGGSPVAPDDTWTRLVNQVATVPVDRVYIDAQDPNVIWIEGGWQPSTPRGFMIRELALQLASGTLYAVAAVPDTYMPLATSGASRSARFRLAIVETDGGVVQLVEDPGEWVVDALAPVLGELLRAVVDLRADTQRHARRLDEHARRIGRLERAMGWARAVLDQVGLNVFRVNTNPTPDP